MTTDETQTGSENLTENQEEGTTSEGQSSQSQEASGNQANDPNAFQADYTRKYQELADQRRAFEQERQVFEAQRSQMYQQPQSQGYTQRQMQIPQGVPNTQSMTDNQLVDLFGQEGAQAIRAREQALVNQFTQSQLDLHIAMEEIQGKNKYGEAEWNKHNYFDPMTGRNRNKIMDYRLSMNPLTGKALTMDEAFRLANPVDPKALEQQVRDKVYQEVTNKTRATPASASKSAPRASGTGHAKSMAEAFEQAAQEIGWTD